MADLADSGLWISGTNDHRWEAKEQLALREIPATAFDVLDTIRSKVSFIGPKSGLVDVRSAFTITHVVPEDSEFSTAVYLLQSGDGGKTWKSEGWSPRVSRSTMLASGGPIKATFTPPTPGSYLLKAKPYLDWIEPPEIEFTTGS